MTRDAWRLRDVGLFVAPRSQTDAKTFDVPSGEHPVAGLHVLPLPLSETAIQLFSFAFGGRAQYGYELLSHALILSPETRGRGAQMASQ